jgi:host factor-I protein
LNKRPFNLQDGFLNQLRRQQIPITLYLSSGVQLRGQLAGFDTFVMILECHGKPTQLVYKHSIVSIAPAWAPVPSPPREPAGDADVNEPAGEAARGEVTVGNEPDPNGQETLGRSDGPSSRVDPTMDEQKQGAL